MKEPVVFVGAGPGDPELITLKGYQALEKADIVIYAGSLVNPDLLEYCSKDCTIYNSAELNLQEIIEITREGVDEGKRVVRLHTGDTSLYGSIREQVEELQKLGIDYQVIPGVSSFLGAAASLGVEYTVPEISQSLIITRIEGRTPVPDKESLASFAKHQTSMAIFLSVQNIEGVVAELTQPDGYSIETPVTVIYKATWLDEAVVQGTLADISHKVREAGIRKTALILVGDFLGSEYNYSKLYDESFSHEYRN
ncbi:cobalt-precorrin-4 C(11)-methyltransferase [Suicoccus acidiformans]|uniref:Cobalt-precorrin-4 C(11)-methyltransferase n=1 Tax=Suicoccus acidiformans TaxID=2036206 RepID=A0A347WM16_9LACT|nr:cobalt-precorrin-4 methyltransferase [Suicoccus acidiformans]AXY26123.1 cobalt-precorrin-4 C(11)-methyltransferase [Suicoccus acidiformans]